MVLLLNTGMKMRRKEDTDLGLTTLMIKPKLSKVICIAYAFQVSTDLSIKKEKT